MSLRCSSLQALKHVNQLIKIHTAIQFNQAKLYCSEQRRVTYRAVYIKETNSHCDEEALLLIVLEECRLISTEFVELAFAPFHKAGEGLKSEIVQIHDNS